MYAELAIIIIVFGVAVLAYLKGKFITSVLTFMASVIAVTTAFGYYETAAGLITGYGFLGQWVYATVFLLIFAIAFIIVNTAFDKLLFAEIYFKDFIDRIGRTVFGILTGFVMAGVLVTAVAMLPIPSQWPYERFAADSEPGNLKREKTLILNADGFVSRVFSTISAGAMRSKTSFAVVHSDFIDELHLNRQNQDEDITIISGSNAIKVKAVWTPDIELTSSSSERPLPQTADNPVIVRIEFSNKKIKEGGGLDENGKVKFVISQLKLICKNKDQSGDLYGKGTAVYPIGFISSANTVEVKKHSDSVAINRGDFTGGVKWLDFVFYIPKAATPVLMQFKQGAIAAVPKLTGSDKAPDAIRFIQASDCERTSATVEPEKSAILYGTKLAAGEDLIKTFPLAMRTAAIFQTVAQNTTKFKMKLSNGKISYTQSKMIYDSYQVSNRSHAFIRILNAGKKQKIIGLKCNNPKVGSSINSTNFPCLKDLDGNIHKPVGVVAKGMVGDKIVFEVDYCSLTDKSENGLTVGPNGNYTKAFPKKIWLTKQASEISEMYFLYLINTTKQTIITDVLPSAAALKGARFKNTSGFLVE
ncbi:MAG: CvpA family protein [Anaerohalosphaeraceae bacterium]|nr:CvpA family protein [Anaerohalosphaeraceae bacterium]